MDTSTAHMLAVLGQLRDGQYRISAALETIARNQRLIAKQQKTISDALLKRLTIRRLWDDYLKPISSILSWPLAAWVLQRFGLGGSLQGALDKLFGFF